MSIVGRVTLNNESVNTFDEPWQAQIFSLVVALQEKRVITLAEWTNTVSEELKGCCSGNDAYYQAWTRSLERLLIEKEIAAPLQLTQLRMAWRLAAEKTPHGSPIVAPNPLFNRSCALPD
jgi:nitrile hydratase accessory protein